MNDEAPPPKKLSDFKPLKRLVLPDIGDLNSSGLTVIVGPNSAGKTQLLRDIKAKITGEVRDLVVSEEIEIDIPESTIFIKCLIAEGYLSSFYDDNDQEQFVSRTTMLGTGQGVPNIQSDQADEMYTKAGKPTKGKRNIEYLAWTAAFLVTPLFLERRLNSITSVGNIDYANAQPTQDLHALHMNPAAMAALSKESVRAFSKSLWTDISRGSLISLKIGSSDLLPTDKQRLSVDEMSKYRDIEDEGDGMKSYIAICISILLGRRPVYLIDEPEMCLHPPQAYSLGQFIGEHGTSIQTGTFVATHSSQVLRGVIQTAEQLQIVRLTQSASGFHATQVSSETLSEAMRKPTVRAETVLDGIFSQAVAIVEADGDRIVYQTAWDKVGAELNFDIHFATVGGLGGIADTCGLYKVLGIPVSVIADLDVVSDKDRFKKIVASLIDDNDAIKGFTDRVQVVIDLIRDMPPNISEDDTKKKLVELADTTHDWSDGTDTALRSKLNSLSNTLYRMRALKEGGLDDLPEEVSNPLGELATDLREIGLFLVPVGELEWWLKDCGIKSSKRKKWAWANEAATFIRDNDRRDDDVWDFIAGLGAYLTGKVM